MPDPAMSSDTSSPIDDRDLIDRLRSGDVRALEIIHAHYWQGLMVSAARYVSDADLAADIVQEVFASLWARHAVWAPRGSIAEYLYAAVRNQAISIARHRRTTMQFRERAAREAGELTDTPYGADVQLEAAELETALRRCLADLPERCRETFLLYRGGDLELAEVAEIMGVSRETAKTQVKRALTALRQVLAAYRR